MPVGSPPTAARRRAELTIVLRTDAAAATSGGQRWLEAQRARSGSLHPEQKSLLHELGLVELPDISTSMPVESRLPARERAFQRGLAAARAFREREGHLDIPQRHIKEIEGEEVRLGQWMSNLRRRHSRISSHRQAALAELGLQM